MLKVIKSIRRWTVLQIDLMICVVSLLLAYFLKYNFIVPDEVWESIYVVLPVALAIKLVVFYFTKSYAGIIRYTSVEDAKKIFVAITSSALLFASLNIIGFHLNGRFFMPFSILLIDYFISMFFMASFRITAKIIHYELKNRDTERINVILYGAGNTGLVTKKTLEQDIENNYKVVAFVDDDPEKSKNMLDGVKIHYTGGDLGALVKSKKAQMVILSIQSAAPERIKEIVEACLAMGVQVRAIPPMNKWINGELSSKQIRNVNIEDILGRDEIVLNTEKLSEDIKGKTILISGAAGSIGSELARQLISFSPGNLILLDHSESALYDLELELSELPVKMNFETVLADIKNKDRMEQVFSTYRPEIVYHAAAYKHVPVMEQHPYEAVLTNVWGSKVAADLSVKYGVKRFVLVSTDKAVNPTGVMGASKRIAEIYTQSLGSSLRQTKEKDINGQLPTKFITTRFGNVLGSNGSVIPRFKKQIEEGGPITVTHPQIRRFFMTIPEACRLVLEAGSMGKGSEIYLFDMGESVKVVDLAKKMIKLSGLTLGKDIQLIFTGLRPGEKLYEELLNDNENTTPTYHPKIMIGSVREYVFKEVKSDIDQLIQLSLKNASKEEITLKMKAIVPEFISKNSEYEKLDKVKPINVSESA